MYSKLALLGFLIFVHISAFSSEVVLSGRAFMQSCGYYSQTSADFRFSYTNTDLPWGSRVIVVSASSGIQSSGQKIEWQLQQENEMSASAPFVWFGQIGRAVQERTSNQHFDQLVFIFKILRPTGEVTYDMGSEKAWSFYAAEIPHDGIRCVSSSEDRPAFSDLSIQRFKR